MNRKDFLNSINSRSVHYYPNKSYESIEGLTSENVMDLVKEAIDTKDLYFGDFLRLKNSLLFYHPTFLPDNKEKMYDLLKLMYIKKWEKLFKNNNNFVITQNIYKISDEKKEEYFKKAEEFKSYYPIEYTYETGEDKSVKYEFSTSYNNLYLLKSDNYLICYTIIPFDKIPRFDNIGFIFEWLYNKYHYFKKTNQVIRFISLTNKELNQCRTKGVRLSKKEKIHNILKGRYSELNTPDFDSGYHNVFKQNNQHLPDKYNPINWVKVTEILWGNKKHTKDVFFNKIRFEWAIPMLRKNHLTHVLNRHKLLHDINNVVNDFGLSYQYYEFKNHIPDLNNDVFISYIKRNKESKNMLYDSDGRLLNIYLTKKAVNKLFANCNNNEIKEVLTYIERIHFIEKNSYLDRHSSKTSINDCDRVKISNIIKQSTNLVEDMKNLSNDFVTKLLDKTNYKNEYLYFDKQFSNYDEWDFPSFVFDMERNHLGNEVKILSHLSKQQILDYISTYSDQYENIQTALHDIALSFRGKLFSKLEEYQIGHNQKNLYENLIKRKYKGVKKILEAINRMDRAIWYVINKLPYQLGNQLSAELGMKNYEQIYRLIISTTATTEIINTIRQIITQVENKIEQYVCSYLTDEEKIYMKETIIEPIKYYKKEISLITLDNWLEDETIKSIVMNKLHNPFPLLKVDYSPNYLNEVIKNAIGVRSKGIKGSIKHPERLYKQLSKIIDPKLFIEGKVADKDTAKQMIPILKNFNIPINSNEMDKYELTAKVENKNSPYYICAGDASVCCMSIGADNMKDYIEKDAFSIINVYFKDRVIANTLIWKHAVYSVLVLDNVEVHPNYKKFNNEIKKIIMELIGQLVEQLGFDLAVLGDSYNDINFSNIISQFEQDEFKKYWYVEAKGKTGIYDDFYTDADECNIILQNKEKEWNTIINEIKKWSFLSNKERNVSTTRPIPVGI